MVIRVFKKLMGLKLRTKLTLFFSAITLIPLLSMGVFTYQVSSKMMKEQVSKGIMENLTQINKNLAFFHVILSNSAIIFIVQNLYRTSFRKAQHEQT